MKNKEIKVLGTPYKIIFINDDKEVSILQLSYGNYVSLNDYVKLQQENQQLKKQKDDVVEYIKYQLSNLDFEKELDMKAKMLGAMILIMLEDNRMLGEIE